VGVANFILDQSICIDETNTFLIDENITFHIKFSI